MATYDIYVMAAVSDAETADQLANSLRNYRMPKGVAIGNGADYRNIITDTTKTAFDEQVRRQLDESRFLVILCSAEAKKSAAFNERLAYFKSTHSSDNVIAVIVRDEPADAFPESFIEKKMVRHILPDQRVIERMETIEPIAADLRADTPKRRKQLLRYETVRIAAYVMNLHPDILEQRQRSRRRKTIFRVLAFAAAVTVIISGIFVRLGLAARKEGVIAEAQTRLSAETAKRTMTELTEQFADEPLALTYIEEAIQNAKESLAEIGMEDLLSSKKGGEEP